MRASAKVLLAAVPLFLAVGCGPPWTVVRLGNPNPITAQAQFSIDATTYNGVTVGRKPEAEYLASKKPEEQQTYQNDKMAFNGGFSAGLMAQKGALDVAGAEAAAGRFSLKSNVVYFEPGIFTHFVNIATEMRTRVTITDPAGTAIDEVEFHCSVGSDMFHPVVAQRVTECGKHTGEHVARYLKQRAGLAK